MSGGKFNYIQNNWDLKNSIEAIENRKGDFPEEVIKEFDKGIHHIKMALVYLQRIDWLLSGDDGEETFLERLKNDLKEIN